ncbi:MAG: hypothetical protein AB7D51_13365 [Desulfovibrionaceae bacterium]
MTRNRDEHCELCGQAIRSIDFYWNIKGSHLCPSCQMATRAVECGERREPDADGLGALLAAAMGPERQLFY